MTGTVDAAVAPEMSHRHATGSSSARGLLFTILGEFVLPTGGAAWTSAIIDVFARLEIEEKTARQALMRTAADGWLSSERVGRRTRWLLTANAERLLTEGTKRIFEFAGYAPDWDGQWLFVLVRVPETDRATRHLLKTRLTRAGLGSPAPGLWISPHRDSTAEVEQILDETGTGLDARIYLAQRHGGASDAGIASQAWDLDELDRKYRRFLTQFASTGTADPLTRVVGLVHAWRRFPWIDPNLPAELLPRRWSGIKASTLFARQHASWAADALDVWAQLNADAG